MLKHFVSDALRATFPFTAVEIAEGQSFRKQWFSGKVWMEITWQSQTNKETLIRLADLTVCLARQGQASHVMVKWYLP